MARGAVSGDAGYNGDESVPRRAAVRLYTATVRQEFAGVLEYDHAVAEKAPPLLRVA